MGQFQVFGSDENTYKVMNLTRSMWWNVDLQAHFCTCDEWQLTGIPCVHAVRILAPLRPDWKRYCSEYFTVQTYKAVYSGSIKPILHETDWSKSTEMDILPPMRPRAPGRPPVARRRGTDEGPSKYNCKKQFRCGICKGYGHNKKTCPGGGPNYEEMMAATAKRGPGRPRTRPRRPLIGEPLEPAYAAAAAEEMMEQELHMEAEAERGRGRGKGRGKGKRKTPQQPGFFPPYMPGYMPGYMPQYMPGYMPQPMPQFIPQMSPPSSVMPPQPSSSEFYMRPPPPPSRQVLRPSTFTSNELRHPGEYNSTLASLLGFNRNQEYPSQRSSEGSNNIATQRSSNASQPSPNASQPSSNASQPSQPTQQPKTTRWMPKG